MCVCVCILGMHLGRRLWGRQVLPGAFHQAGGWWKGGRKCLNLGDFLQWGYPQIIQILVGFSMKKRIPSNGGLGHFGVNLQLVQWFWWGGWPRKHQGWPAMAAGSACRTTPALVEVGAPKSKPRKDRKPRASKMKLKVGHLRGGFPTAKSWFVLPLWTSYIYHKTHRAILSNCSPTSRNTGWILNHVQNQNGQFYQCFIWCW